MFCHKVPHETKADARADINFRVNQARHFNKRYRDKVTTKKLKPYECQYCSKWHVK